MVQRTLIDPAREDVLGFHRRSQRRALRMQMPLTSGRDSAKFVPKCEAHHQHEQRPREYTRSNLDWWSMLFAKSSTGCVILPIGGVARLSRALRTWRRGWDSNP